jgi:hypothetical protein
VRAKSASLLIERLKGLGALMLLPLARQACHDVASTETFFTEKRSTNARELLVGRPQTGLAGRQRCTNFVITSDKEGGSGPFHSSSRKKQWSSLRTPTGSFQRKDSSKCS